MTMSSNLRPWFKAVAARSFLAVLVAFLLVGSACPQNASSQPPSTPASETAAKLGTLTTAERTELIAKLDDQQVRELVLYFMGQTAPAATPQNRPEDLLKELEQRADLLRANAIAALGSVDNLPGAVRAAHTKLTSGSGIGYLGVLVALAALLIVATGV